LGDGLEPDAASYLALTDLNALREPIEPLSAWLARRVLSADSVIVLAAAGNPFDVGFV